MKMDLKKPCADCPFRRDVTPYLTLPRATQILSSIFKEDLAFPCHKHLHGTLDDDEDSASGYQHHKNDQHCAGAMIILMKAKMPNQWMRIMGRLGAFHAEQLRMNAPVYESADEMIAAYTNAQHNYDAN